MNILLNLWGNGRVERKREIAVLNNEVEVEKKKKKGWLSYQRRVPFGKILYFPHDYMRSFLLYIYIYILILTPTYVTSNLMEKYKFVSHTQHMQRKINGSTSFTIDNMCYVNFKI